MINNNYYNISFAQYAVDLLTNNYRTDLVIAFLKALTEPIEDLNTQFTSFRESIDYRSYSQVCYMQGLLNDSFDPIERRIKVRNATLNRDYYLFWKESKNKPVMLKKQSGNSFEAYLLSRDYQVGTHNKDFEVVLPVGYILSEDESIRIQNLIDQSKLASKQYIITYG